MQVGDTAEGIISELENRFLKQAKRRRVKACCSAAQGVRNGTSERKNTPAVNSVGVDNTPPADV